MSSPAPPASARSIGPALRLRRAPLRRFARRVAHGVEPREGARLGSRNSGPRASRRHDGAANDRRTEVASNTRPGDRRGEATRAMGPGRGQPVNKSPEQNDWTPTAFVWVGAGQTSPRPPSTGHPHQRNREPRQTYDAGSGPRDSTLNSNPTRTSDRSISDCPNQLPDDSKPTHSASITQPNRFAYTLEA